MVYCPTYALHCSLTTSYSTRRRIGILRRHKMHNTMIHPRSTPVQLLAEQSRKLALNTSSTCDHRTEITKIATNSLEKMDLIIKVSTYFFWNATNGSFSRSDISLSFPFAMTSGCFLHNSQPTCEKKNPRFALCGSAFVSVNLWCTRWSRDHSNTLFWNSAEFFGWDKYNQSTRL